MTHAYHRRNLYLGNNNAPKARFRPPATVRVFTAAAKLLDIPQSELGGTLYENDRGGMSLMIYDDVPGGAGHAQQLSEMVDSLLREAYGIVADCTCSRDTCCYGCISNYNNQSKQARLSRGAAADILGALLDPALSGL